MTVKKRAQEQRVKNLERALKEERIGLVAVARAFLEESPDGGAAVLRRLEGMIRNASKAGVPARTRDALEHGHAVLERATQQVQGRPQSLFEPDVGHVRPTVVEALVKREPEQLGLGVTTNAPLADVQQAQSDRDQVIAEARDVILASLKTEPRGDWGIVQTARSRGCLLSVTLLKEQRKELTKLGRVVQADTDGGGPTWKLLEA